MKVARVNGDSFSVRFDPTGLGGTAAMPALAQLSDVDTTGLVDGDVLVWDTTSGTWIPGTSSGITAPVEVVAASGSAVEIDYDVAHWWDITLTDDCALTIVNAPDSATAGVLFVILRQGGAGSFTVTWPAEVQWDDGTGLPGGPAPTLNTAVGAQDVIELVTLDGGTTWGGTHDDGGSSISPATTVEDETTFGIAPAVGTDLEYARQDHTHGSPSTATLQAAGHYEVLMDGSSPPLPLEDGSGTDWLYVWVS